MKGHVYIKFQNSEQATKALKDLNNRHFANRRLQAEAVPLSHYLQKFQMN